MDEQKYRLMLTGQVLEGVDVDHAVEKLGKLLRIQPEQARKMLRGKRSRLQKELSRERAEHLQKKLERRGVDCLLEPQLKAGADTVQNLAAEHFPEIDGDVEELVLELPDLDDNTRPMTAISQQALDQAESQATRKQHGSEPSEQNRIKKPGVKIPQVTLPDGMPDRRLLIAAGIAVLLVVTVAGVLLFGDDPVEPSGPEVVATKSVAEPPDSLTRKRQRSLLRLVKVWMIQYGDGYNPSLVTLERLRSDLEIPTEDMQDGWNTPFRYAYGDDRYSLLSAGPDTTFGTADDIDLVSELGL
ncbi:MAG: hypothetical protein GY934_00355 [Gammaproteobacteria bacterium]|nr:hypothetical protein [Gammaproteobacteria bacterium]